MTNLLSSEIPGDITPEIWMDYAGKGQAEKLDSLLAQKYSDFRPDFFEEPISDPVEYANRIQSFFVHEYKDELGKDKLRDIYVVRRLAFSLAEAKRMFESGNKDLLGVVAYEDGVAEAFQILAENYSNAKQGEAGYYKDFEVTGIFPALFGSLMDTLPLNKVEGVLNMVTNTEDFEKIMNEYKKHRVEVKGDV
jgi:hypothetical protein